MPNCSIPAKTPDVSFTTIRIYRDKATRSRRKRWRRWRVCFTERWANRRHRRDENDALLPTNPAIYDVAKFWKSGIGVVAPHRAQGSLIGESLRGAFKNAGATPALIRDTVERFQGQERDAILASIGLGDPDMVALEDEFLFSLNRFSVLISRAKALVFLSRGVLNHLSDDQKIVRESALLKSFVERQCRHSIELELPCLVNNIETWVSGEFRFV